MYICIFEYIIYTYAYVYNIYVYEKRLTCLIAALSASKARNQLLILVGFNHINDPAIHILKIWAPLKLLNIHFSFWIGHPNNFSFWDMISCSAPDLRSKGLPEKTWPAENHFQDSPRNSQQSICQGEIDKSYNESK